MRAKRRTPIHKSMKHVPISRLIDFALGHLPPEESLKLLEEIEKSEELSERFDLVVELVNLFQGDKPTSPLRLIQGRKRFNTSPRFA